MSIKQYRCVTTSLAIRTQPKVADQFKTQQQLKLNDVITADDETRTESDGFIWLKHNTGWSAERAVDGSKLFLLDTSLKPKDKMWGLNIDPYNPAGNPPASKLAGVGWVRFVFHVSGQRQTLEQAFAYYDPIIKSFIQTGTKILLVIIQDTYWGNAPWNNGDWNGYIPGYVDLLRKIVQRYRGQVAAYEIWNEGDLPADQQSVPTSIYIPPQNYAALLSAASQAIRQADPTAKVISGGLVSSNAINYMRAVRDALGGRLPVNGIGIHPYGQTIPEATVFPGWSQGSLIDYILRMSENFPGIPLWITEYGVPRVDVNNTAFWPPIANYMLKTFQSIRSNFFHLVPVVIWFAWADSMDNAGIVKDSQQPKGILYETFFQNARADQPGYTRTAEAPFDATIALTHVAGQFVTENTITELAQHVFTYAPNVGALIVKTSAGPLWEARGDSKKSMAIGSVADIEKWTGELAKYRLDFHAWHDISGQDVNAETKLISQIALAPGVRSVVLDVDVSRLILSNSGDIRNFMTLLKKLLPATFHLGLSFDGRPESYKTVNLLEWYPFINSWHPRIFHGEFSSGQQGPEPYFKAMYEALKPYPKPIIPMLQAEPTAGKPIPPDQIKQAAKIAFETYKAPAVSFWRLGAIGTAEFNAIQAITIPYTAGLSPAEQNPDIMVVQLSAALRIRSEPSLSASVVGTLQPGEQITVLERRVIGSILWVRHNKGWSVARNAQTGEIYLA